MMEAPPEFWKAETRYRIEQMQRGDPTDSARALALAFLKLTLLALTPSRQVGLSEARKAEARAAPGT